MVGVELAEALAACGFKTLGSARTYRRFELAPGIQVVIPLDPSASDYVETFASAVDVLSLMVELGAQAARALQMARKPA